jgi:hypothetical protein
MRKLFLATAAFLLASSNAMAACENRGVVGTWFNNYTGTCAGDLGDNYIRGDYGGGFRAKPAPPPNPAPSQAGGPQLLSKPWACYTPQVKCLLWIPYNVGDPCVCYLQGGATVAGNIGVP